MTLLTNHRISSKKTRRLSPTIVKMPFRTQSRQNKKSTIVQKLHNAILYSRTMARAAPTPHPSPTLKSAPAPSAPLAQMTNRTVYVWDQEFHVEIPMGFDIYEGLRLWYPDLYRAVMEEERLIRGEPSTPTLSEEEMEEAWARYEYLEYLSDY
jgi:hypothetical protein